jgi:hypothetical protein
MINLIPAKWNGVSYCSPSLIPAYAVDHSRQAIIAQKIVFPLLFNLKKSGVKYQKKIILINVTEFELN